MHTHRIGFHLLPVDDGPVTRVVDFDMYELIAGDFLLWIRPGQVHRSTAPISPRRLGPTVRPGFLPGASAGSIGTYRYDQPCVLRPSVAQWSALQGSFAQLPREYRDGRPACRSRATAPVARVGAVIGFPDAANFSTLRAQGADPKLVHRAVTAALAGYVHLRAQSGQSQPTAAPRQSLAGAVRQELEPQGRRIARLEEHLGLAAED
ncbi:hypothetical protein [Streptomyces sp. HUAS TT7]|uniref:hypothetical protein n=1 Tax=Streptomyces sp. HUAS TT7 TaxID=3447507 RepID=UPI003F65E8BD